MPFSKLITITINTNRFPKGFAACWFLFFCVFGFALLVRWHARLSLMFPQQKSHRQRVEIAVCGIAKVPQYNHFLIPSNNDYRRHLSSPRALHLFSFVFFAKHECYLSFNMLVSFEDGRTMIKCSVSMSVLPHVNYSDSSQYSYSILNSIHSNQLKSIAKHRNGKTWIKRLWLEIVVQQAVSREKKHIEIIV